MTPLERDCAACDAPAGQPCDAFCIGAAAASDASLETERRAAHGLIGRWMTVEASQAYHRLDLLARLTELRASIETEEA